MSIPDNTHFDPDDPRLTAYALGELPDLADHAHVEALLAASPEARAELADIRALTVALTAEYEQERLAAPEAAAGPVPAPTNIVYLPEPRWDWVRPLLATAAVLLLIAIGYSMLPVFNSVQVKGQHHPGAVLSVQTELEPPTPAGSVEASTATSSVAQTNEESSDKKLGAAPVEGLAVGGSASPVPAATLAPLLAQTELPAFELRDGRTLNDMAAKPAPSAQAPSYFGSVALNQSEPVGINAGRDLSLARAKAAPQASVRRPVIAAPAAAPALAYADTPAKELSPGSPPVAANMDVSGKSVTRLIQHDAAFDTAAYDHITETPFLAAKDNPLSTFSVDVDTASYAIVRRFIENGSLPPPGAVRIEEMLNYFPYDYAPPAPDDERPFAIHLEGASCPWNPDHRLVRVALKGRELAQDKRPPSNLVFLIDVSGSMEPAERLPLIKESFRLLVEKLTDNDHVAIVVYAGNTGLVLPSTNGAHKDKILLALDRLEAGGSTNGASGIQLAYKVAQQGFIKGGTNRVILATDGDFNVGTTNQGELVRLIEKEAKGGVFLTCLGVGTDNLKDSTMQKLADHGNGNYAYLDRIEEAQKVLVEQMSGTLVTIAKDVKIQVEFNPAAVQSYRLIGYEKRLLRKEDFNDDRVDAGEIGAGHSVTALYEVVPTGQTDAGAAPAVDSLKYQPAPEVKPVRASAPSAAGDREMLTVKIRHKAPDSDVSERSYEAAFVDHVNGTADFANATPDFKFAAAVATFGLALRDSPYKGNATLGAAVELAQEGKGADASGYRAEFIELARRAQALSSTK